MSVKDFAEKFIKALEGAFEKGDFDALSKLEDPDVVYHTSTRGDLVGHKAHRQDILDGRQTGSERKRQWEYLTGEGNLFALSFRSSGRVTGEGLQGPSLIGKNLATHSLWVYRLKNGRIVEGWSNGSRTITD